MIDLLVAAVMLQQAAPDPCYAAARGDTAMAGCPQWRLARRGDGNANYHDPASVHRAGARVEITIRTVLPQPTAGGAQSFNARLRLDCTARTKQIIHLTAFDPAGRRLLDEPVTSEAPARPPAGSAYADLLDEYCGAGRS